MKNGSPPIVATWNLSNTAIFHVHDYGRKCILPYITHLRLVGHVHILWRWIFIPIAIIWGWQWKSSPMKTRGQGGPEKDQLMVWLGGLDSWDPLFMKGIATDRLYLQNPKPPGPKPTIRPLYSWKETWQKQQKPPICKAIWIINSPCLWFSVGTSPSHLAFSTWKAFPKISQRRPTGFCSDKDMTKGSMGRTVHLPTNFP